MLIEALLVVLEKIHCTPVTPLQTICVSRSVYVSPPMSLDDCHAQMLALAKEAPEVLEMHCLAREMKDKGSRGKGA